MSSTSSHRLPTVDAETPPVLVLPPFVGRDDVGRLSRDVRARLESAPGGAVVCDVGRVVTGGLALVDVLARLQLAARRAGGHLRVRGPSPELRALLGLLGLPLEVEGEPEQREPPLGVEEAVEPGDPAA
ncbi:MULTISPECIES: STAS domain-containing protein [unclassified Streptomyces]|uniref:STAS domain-containing protein n=1 Tax=unclassified Streptomyces TaxID=2593676 RepID=UPI0009987709|nr:MULTISPECIES: STAS domain-containing protein [unclassified Streptomyces]